MTWISYCTTDGHQTNPTDPLGCLQANDTYNWGDYSCHAYPYITVSPNTTYTFSFWVKTAETTLYPCMMLHLGNLTFEQVANWPGYLAYTTVTVTPNTWFHVTWDYTTGADDGQGNKLSPYIDCGAVMLVDDISFKVK